MCIRSKHCSPAQTAGIIAGAALVVGVVVAATLLLKRHAEVTLDPLEETDRRITELEQSLRRLHDNFGQTTKR